MSNTETDIIFPVNQDLFDFDSFRYIVFAYLYFMRFFQFIINDRPLLFQDGESIGRVTLPLYLGFFYCINNV